MSDPRAEKFKAAVAAVNEVLYNEWAPIGFIGGLPQDEYESYAIRVVSMLASGADEAELAAYLARTGAAISGNEMSIENCLSVAKHLSGFREGARAIAL